MKKVRSSQAGIIVLVEKQPRHVATYRNYENYNKDLFEKDIQVKLSKIFPTKLLLTLLLKS